MDKLKEVHLEFLRKKYLELSRQYVSALQSGKSIEDLKDLADVINTIVKEMEDLEEKPAE